MTNSFKSLHRCIQETKLRTLNLVPLGSVHLENMLEMTKAGAVVFPRVIAFSRPNAILELVDQSVGRMIDSWN